jgi:sulfur-oxidizing protein SoxB
MLQRGSSSTRIALLLALVVAASFVFPGRAGSQAGRGKAQRAVTITLIHMGDLHGHLVPCPNVRSDATGKTAGGLARMYTRIEEIRRRSQHSLLLNTGDTIQGSAEALFTRGQAIAEVVDEFKIDYFAPGNWDFVYGSERFLELFGGEKARWGAISANLYYDGAPFAGKNGALVIAPYQVRSIAGVKLGILGLTTDRGPQVVSQAVTKGFRFTSGDEEVPRYIKELREKHHVDAIILLSEQGLANNIRMAETYPGIDVILSSDMHEVTRQPIVTSTGTVIVEEGQDGTRLGEVVLRFESRKLAGWNWVGHDIDERIKENAPIATKVAEVRRSFVSGPAFLKHKNPFNGLLLTRPIDTVVGETAVALHRSNFSNEAMPAVIEGTSHDFLADAFREVTGADVGATRGFRFGTHVPPGPIRLEDLYHFIPIGPMIAKGTIKGRQLKNQIENSAEGTLSSVVKDWTGGWLFNYSGLTAKIDPTGSKGNRALEIRVRRSANAEYENLDPEADYTYASYYYAADPNLIGVVPAKEIQIYKDGDGTPLDGVEVVARYLATLPGKRANPGPARFTLVRPLPLPAFGSPEIQPLQGVAPN